MILAEVLHLLIEDGVEAARHRGGDPRRVRGEMDGCAACRGREPAQMMDLLLEAAVARVEAEAAGSDDIGYRIGYEQGIQRIGAVMSCALEYHGLPPITAVTAADRIRYAGIVGYEETNARNRR